MYVDRYEINFPFMKLLCKLQSHHMIKYPMKSPDYTAVATENYQKSHELLNVYIVIPCCVVIMFVAETFLLPKDVPGL